MEYNNFHVHLTQYDWLVALDVYCLLYHCSAAKSCNIAVLLLAAVQIGLLFLFDYTLRWYVLQLPCSLAYWTRIFSIPLMLQWPDYHKFPAWSQDAYWWTTYFVLGENIIQLISPPLARSQPNLQAAACEQWLSLDWSYWSCGLRTHLTGHLQW